MEDLVSVQDGQRVLKDGFGMLSLDGCNRCSDLRQLKARKWALANGSSTVRHASHPLRWSGSCTCRRDQFVVNVKQFYGDRAHEPLTSVCGESVLELRGGIRAMVQRFIC